MYKLIAILCALALISGRAHPQETTYDYTGATMSGTIQFDPYQYSPPQACTGCLALDGTMVLSNPLGDNLSNVQITPLSSAFGFNVPPGNPSGVMIPTSIDISTDAQGQITAWNVALTSDGGGSAYQFYATIASGGDGGVYMQNGDNITNAYIYTVSNTVSGSWIDPPSFMAAPEIGLEGSIPALTLLIGWVLLLQGKKSRS